MFVRTHNPYRVNEVLTAQPSVIVGVTGSVTVFSYTVYDISISNGINFFAFIARIGTWALITHWILVHLCYNIFLGHNILHS